MNRQTANYITQTVYWPHGAVRQMGYGNNVWHDLGTVSARLQPTGYWDTIGENPNAFLRVEYPNWVNGSGKNNGTLQSTQIFAGAPAPWQSLPNVTQNFGYDNLNRLTSASEGANWSQAYNYDQYGNMWMPGQHFGRSAAGTRRADRECVQQQSQYQLDVRCSGKSDGVRIGERGLRRRESPEDRRFEQLSL